MTSFARLLAAAALSGASAVALATAPIPTHAVACVDGMAEGYPCSNVDLSAHLSLAALGATAGQEGNDIWGWTDASNDREYALVGVGNGTAFVDVTVPEQPLVLGLLPTHSSNSLWRDIKVYADHAFIVSEAASHGMQVFDLTRLRNVPAPPVTFTADAHYGGFGRAHNIVINEDTGFAYAVGSRDGTACSGGLHMIDISTPLSPQFAGCFSADGYTHDAQCVVYAGPDTAYTGREICFNSNEDTLTIVDVTVKAAPVQVARVGYTGNRYAHQGWLAPGHRWFLMDDELDESNNGHNTRTYVWDLQDLDNPQQTFAYTAAVGSIDHNLYIRGQHAFLANYRSGLRILDLSAIEQGQIEEVAFFDTYPANDNTGFQGAWSSYPFFASGTVVVSDINRGLFVLQPRLCQEPAVATGLVAQGTGDNVIELAWDAAIEPDTSYEVYRELGGCGAGPGVQRAGGLTSPAFIDSPTSGQVDYGYRVRVVAAGGQCRSAFSACVEASTTGACTAAPLFDGLESASTPGEARCAVDLDWKAATPTCAGPPVYEVHRSLDAAFVPAPDTLIQDAGETSSTRDYDVESGQTYHYVVRARDAGNAASDDNLVRRSVTPVGEITSGTWSNGAEVGESLFLRAADGVVPLHAAWHATEAAAHTGLRSYFSGYANADCIALTTPAIDLGSDGESVLSFYQSYGIESGWDGGRIEISADGNTWNPIVPIGGYPFQITNAGNACGWPIGTGVFSGTTLGWHAQSVDLSSWSGSVYLRWVFSTDTAVTGQGWWIDTIEVSPARISGRCSTIPVASTLTITAHSPEPSTAGSVITVAFGLELSPPEAGAPSGSVTVTADGEADSCVALLPETSCQLSLSQPGSHTLTAEYSGGGFAPPANDSVLHEVVRAQATLDLVVISMTPSPVGDVQVSVTIGGAENLAAPTGTILVQSNLEVASCSIELPADSCTLTLQAPGTHTLTASYPGDALYQAGTDNVQHLVYSDAHLFGDGFEQTLQ